jgi:predicted MFS family arabinose efflux permease
VLLLAAVLTAFTAPIETIVTVGLVFAAVVLFVFATAHGTRFTGTQAILAELAAARRGTAMALGAAFQQFGVVSGSAAGAIGLSLTGGYGILGPISSLFTLVAFVLMVRFVDERTLAKARAAEESVGGLATGRA